MQYIRRLFNTDFKSKLHTKYHKLIEEVMKIYQKTNLQIESEHLRDLFHENRLAQIRENWKTMFFILKILFVVVLIILSFDNDGIALLRAILL